MRLIRTIFICSVFNDKDRKEGEYMGIEHLHEVYIMYRKEWGGRLNKEIFEKHVKELYPVLIDVARKRSIINYKKLDDEFHISRADIGPLVGAISTCETKQGAPPLSALVINKNYGTPGGGFLGLECTPPHLYKRHNSDDKPLFTNEEIRYWEETKKQVYEYWEKKR